MLTFDPRALLSFSPDGRSVQRLHRSADTDVLLVCWEPGQWAIPSSTETGVSGFLALQEIEESKRDPTVPVSGYSLASNSAGAT